MPEQFSLSVVCPCLNEEANLPLLAERLFAATKEAGITTELVIVDDGSTDGTARRRSTNLEARIRRRGADRCATPRTVASPRAGVRASTRRAARYVCLIDGDLQNPPEEVVTLYLRLLESAADLAQGTRSSIGRLRDSRLLLSRVLNGLLNLVFGMRAKDSKSGFVLGPKPVIDDVITHQRQVPPLPDVHLGVRAREGLLDPRGRDPLREPVRGRVVPGDTGSLRVSLAGVPRLRSVDRGVPLRRAAPPQQGDRRPRSNAPTPGSPSRTAAGGGSGSRRTSRRCRCTSG